MKDKKQQKQTNKLPILIKMERNYAAAIVLSLVEINPLLLRVPDDDRF